MNKREIMRGAWYGCRTWRGGKGAIEENTGRETEGETPVLPERKVQLLRKNVELRRKESP